MEPMMCISECDKCLKLDPKFCKAYERKGKAYYMMKKFEDAAKTFKKGCEIDPEH
jgi:stress-induced-phosphoprotein 1